MEQLLTELGHRIRSAREIQGLSQEELAARVGINNSFLSQVERGLKAPSLKTVFGIAQALDISVGQLFADEEDATRILTDREVAALLGDASSDQRKDLVELLRVGIKLTGR